jgi:hypothetical protein
MFKTMMRAAAMLLLLAVPAQGQEFWEKLPYQEWTREQCLKMLRDSPWSKTFTISTVKQDRFGQPTKGESRQTEQHVYYYAQLRSALPVRQAVVRQAQIEEKYEKMNDAERRAFDVSADRYLRAQYDDIIVHVDYASDVEFFERDLAVHWQTRPPGEILNASVYLTTSRGARIAPKDFKTERGSGRAFEFIFPREVNGEPLVTADVTSIRVEFPNPQIRDLNDQRTAFEFRVDKMKFRGATVY